MRIAIISPYSAGPMRGNITTVKRIEHHLSCSGIHILTLPIDRFSPEEMLKLLHTFNPDIIHAFHAYHCGPVACFLASALNRPFIITITGSDINQPDFREDPATIRAMSALDGITCFDIKTAYSVISHFPASAEKLKIIPQGVEQLPVNNCSPLNIPDDSFVMLLPAALRPVKQIEFAIKASAPLVGKIKNLLLVIAGGIINTEYCKEIKELLKFSPHAIWIGEVDMKNMGCLYKRADIILNCSIHEDMPNSLLEAMALARPVLAADINGNSSLITHAETGWLYNGESDFRTKLHQLYESPAIREAIGKNARQYVLSFFSTNIEASNYIKLYKSTVMTE